ncbi:unnamed protein product [Polarella glacialis]|uniref:Methyltransferase FkbM domain-containing protein n=1 Tax=Polarella glacialis TaxID=89957 RepID=A0A813FTU7_POLGL|nr:unnamed protein product [Polarella glacialis]CAE8739253.1 unnamed protein product [Polarella glacialis]
MPLPMVAASCLLAVAHQSMHLRSDVRELPDAGMFEGLPQAWDGASVLGNDPKGSAENFTMKDGPYLAGASPPLLVIRAYSDAISDHIRSEGVWFDCPVLGEIWDKLPCPPSSPQCTKNFMDIGANIGACSLQMMARNDVAHTFAFEPNYANLFYLTRSILGNNMSQRVSLFPQALGDAPGQHRIYERPGNMGSTALDASNYGNGTASGEVAMVTLDSLMVAAGMPYVHLAKMDVEGYEMKVLAGASNVLSSGMVHAWKVELSPAFLELHNSSALHLLNAFITNRYDLYHVAGWEDRKANLELMSREVLRNYACEAHPRNYQREFLAVLHGQQARSPLACA